MEKAKLQTMAIRVVRLAQEKEDLQLALAETKRQLALCRQLAVMRGSR